MFRNKQREILISGQLFDFSHVWQADILNVDGFLRLRAETVAQLVLNRFKTVGLRNTPASSRNIAGDCKYLPENCWALGKLFAYLPSR